MAWTPISREEAEAVLAEPRFLGGILPLETAAREYEAQLVAQGKSATEIYELLTDFLGHRPDAPNEQP